MSDNKQLIQQAVSIIKDASHVCAFTGAGISVESGIPPFRGADGLWTKYNPKFIEIDYFLDKPIDSWKLIKEIFYDFIGKAEPNPAHYALAKLEDKGLLKAIITQNIDDLHQRAGSKVVHEFHGTSGRMICLDCKARFAVKNICLDKLPPECPECAIGTIKPDFIFFGEAIPQDAYANSIYEAQTADVFIVIGTTGEVMPACMIPQIARQNGAKIIEVNTQPSAFTHGVTTHFLKGTASEVLSSLLSGLE